MEDVDDDLDEPIQPRSRSERAFKIPENPLYHGEVQALPTAVPPPSPGAKPSSSASSTPSSSAPASTSPSPSTRTKAPALEPAPPAVAPPAVAPSARPASGSSAPAAPAQPSAPTTSPVVTAATGGAAAASPGIAAPPTTGTTAPQGTGSPPPPGPESLSPAELAGLEAATGWVVPGDFLEFCLTEICQKSLISPAAVKKHLHDYLRDSGAANDVNDRMWFGQLLLAHYRLAQLHVQASKAESPESIKLLSMAASRLMDAFGRYMLSVQQHRADKAAPKPPKRRR
jgi:hypothetical protein